MVASVAALKAERSMESGGKEGGGEDGISWTASHGAASSEDENMGENGHDFLQMMGDKNESGRFLTAGEALEELQEVLARHRV